MDRFDYVIVGAGTAGCVLADRLSENREVSVLLIEAGGEDTDPRISMPRGFAELLGDPGAAWHYPTRPVGPAGQVEYWVRGRTLGGSSSVNGMVYNRGHRADYDALADRGARGGDGRTCYRSSARSRTTSSGAAGYAAREAPCPSRPPRPGTPCSRTSSPPAPHSVGGVSVI